MCNYLRLATAILEAHCTQPHTVAIHRENTYATMGVGMVLKVGRLRCRKRWGVWTEVFPLPTGKSYRNPCANWCILERKSLMKLIGQIKSNSGLAPVKFAIDIYYTYLFVSHVRPTAKRQTTYSTDRRILGPTPIVIGEHSWAIRQNYES